MWAVQGQKLQGTLTCKEIHTILEREGKTDEYPLFTIIYKIGMLACVLCMTCVSTFGSRVCMKC